MGSVLELVLYCLLWVLMQGIIYMVIYYISISYDAACLRALHNNAKIICYLFGALSAAGLCIMKKRDFFTGIRDVRTYGKGGVLEAFVLQGVLLVTAVYVVEVALRVIILFARDHGIRRSDLGMEFMKGKISISELLMSVLIAPVCEEILFRGLLYERLLAFVDNASAIIIVGIIFGLFHIQPKKMAYAFLVSIVLSFCYVNGGIVVAVACHSFYNLLSNFYITIKKEKANETK